MGDLQKCSIIYQIDWVMQNDLQQQALLQEFKSNILQIYQVTKKNISINFIYKESGYNAIFKDVIKVINNIEIIPNLRGLKEKYPVYIDDLFF